MIDKLAHRPWLAILLTGVLAFCGSATVAFLVGKPEPRTHDEFSYLLAADTFAHGRLANPTHPLWVHFESMHIIQQPTYASKFPPAQGMFLALGQVVTGDPVAGLWLSVAFMCAAISWMLYGWVPPRWALFGGLLVVVRLGLIGDWAQTYWGGAVAAGGGALVFGALRRVVSGPRVRDALMMGLGLAILANSRPYEGLFASAPAAIILLTWLLGRNGTATIKFARVVLPLAAVLTLTAVGMAYYNLSVTGNVARLPYQVHAATYRVEPIFLWQSPKPEPVYRHQALRDFHVGFELGMYQRQHPIGAYAFRAIKADQFAQLWTFFLGPWLTLPLVMLPWMVKDRWTRFALITCGVVGVGLLLETWILKHYAAPIAGLMIALSVEGLRTWQARDRPVGRFVAWLVAIVSILQVTAAVASDLRGTPPAAWHTERAALLRQLEAQAGDDLVVVRYGPQHSVQEEWVYNRADIDRAPVVWARYMDPESNRRLVEFFSQRRAWLLDIDSGASRPVLRPYGTASDR